MTGSSLDTRWLQVLRLSPAVATRLKAAAPEAGRVHSVFKRAVNLSWHDGGLLTSQALGALAAPFAAALARMPAADAIHPSVSVGRRGDTLVLGGVGVRWRGTTLTNTAMRESPGAPPPALAVLMDECRGQSGRALWNPIGRRARNQGPAEVRRRWKWSGPRGIRSRPPTAYRSGHVDQARPPVIVGACRPRSR